MMSKFRIRLVVALAAVVFLTSALLAGSDGNLWSIALQTISITVSVATVAFLIYEKWAWAWLPVRILTNKPNMNGTWRGKLQSNYLRDGKPIPAIPAVIRVKQTDSRVLITLFTGESSSYTQLSEFVKEPDDRWRLTFLYTNKPRPEVSDRSEQHQGLCELYVTGKGDSLTGHYFTNRSTKGGIKFNEWSKNAYGDASSALEAKNDFVSPKLFVR